ncbi:cell division protein FtsW [Bacillus sp. VT 712]|uniref:Probable peptidoglycan glycosyltransferase FtsW n=1 Tax=Priestia veravalensis TaxID=1414648 RepID=A0A0V8JPB9_9BACI|nr:MULTISPECIES: FtsW/RodA/SpoVE family cell cycle protein [Bacillaceae]KSU88895.1 cell division protein FtsW [Priestia veravalensis]KZB90609.1 cell division protein FtsW [Bacillus sp. VT 712]MCM3068364.1 FtsW/RodA/SpoVE family cell cycle protein [Priestia flexa]MCP1188162.1 FtsW/RodA/SpoVE family cell cycle protein [Priestia flexa]SCC02377.1 cell division protein FtsW [Priestia flexa]
MFKKILKCYDYKFIFAIVFLCLIGLLMVYSSSMITAITRYGVSADYFYQKQKIALILGLLIFCITSFVPYKIYSNKKLLQCSLLIVIMLLVAVLIFGHTAGNAQSWFKIGPLTIQPLEVTKLVLIIYLAAVLSKKQSYINDLKRSIMPPAMIVCLICFLIALQPDYGGILLILITCGSIVVCSGIELKTILKLVLLSIIIMFIVLLILLITGNLDIIFSPVRLGRFTSFMNPFEEELGNGYQLVNSYLAISNGGILGSGLGQSIQKAGYLPESHTDFIMAVIADELGFLGVVVVLFLLFFIVFRGLKISIQCQDSFGALLAVGISVMIGIQAFVNLGAVTGILPITGVTLPFISFGGSSLVLLLGSIGVVVNISMFNRFEKKYKYKRLEVT